MNKVSKTTHNDINLEHLYEAIQNLQEGESPKDQTLHLSNSLEVFKRRVFDLLDSTRINDRKFSSTDIILYDDNNDLLVLELSQKSGESNVIKNVNEGLQSVVCSGDYKRFQLLSNSKCLIDFNRFPTGCQKSLLHIACERGHLQIVKDLVSVHGVSPNIRYFDYTTGRTGMTPLHSAVLFDRRNIVKYLLKAGAKKNIPYLGITAGKLIQAKKELRGLERSSSVIKAKKSKKSKESRKSGKKKKILRSLKKKRSVRKIENKKFSLEYLRKKLNAIRRYRFMLSSADLKILFKLIGNLKFEKKMNTKLKKNKLSGELNDMVKANAKFEKNEKKRKALFDLREKIKEISAEKSRLLEENEKLRKMVNQKVEDIKEESKEIPRVVSTDCLKEKIMSIEAGIQEMKKIAEKELILKKKQMVQRRLKAAQLSSDVTFVKKLLKDLEKMYPDIDLKEMKEYGLLIERIKEHEDKIKKIKEERTQEKLKQFDMFSVPPQNKEQIPEEPKKVEIKPKKKQSFDDIMVTSVYAINNAISRENEEKEIEDMMKEFCVL